VGSVQLMGKSCLTFLVRFNYAQEVGGGGGGGEIMKP
jgi:hypothetical protein